MSTLEKIPENQAIFRFFSISLSHPDIVHPDCGPSIDIDQFYIARVTRISQFGTIRTERDIDNGGGGLPRTILGPGRPI